MPLVFPFNGIPVIVLTGSGNATFVRVKFLDDPLGN